MRTHCIEQASQSTSNTPASSSSTTTSTTSPAPSPPNGTLEDSEQQRQVQAASSTRTSTPSFTASSTSIDKNLASTATHVCSNGGTANDTPSHGNGTLTHDNSCCHNIHSSTSSSQQRHHRTSGNGSQCSVEARSRYSKENNTNSSGIDDDAFKAAFAATPVLHNFNTREIKSSFEQIRDCLADPNNDWEKRFDSLKRIRSLILSNAHHSSDFKALLKLLEIPLQITLKDLRSQIVRETCFTVAFMAQNVEANHFDHTAETVIPNLQLLLQNSAKVMSNSALITIKYILKYTQSSRIILPILSGMSSKSKDIRRHSCKFIYRILLEWNVEIWAKYIISIQEAIKTGIDDPDGNARMYSRCSFTQFQKFFPGQAEQLFNSLDSSKKKLLKEDCGTTGSRPGDLPADHRNGRAATLGSGRYLTKWIMGGDNPTEVRPHIAGTPRSIKSQTMRQWPSQQHQQRVISSSQPSSRNTSPSLKLFCSKNNGRRTPLVITRRSNDPEPALRGMVKPNRSLTIGNFDKRRVSKESTQKANRPDLADHCSNGNGTLVLSDEESSGCSDQCSLRSSQARITEHFNDILHLLSSPQWDDKFEGLTMIQEEMKCRRFSKGELRKIIEQFNKLFSASHGKAFSLFLELLASFIEQYHNEVSDWIDAILLGLLSKNSRTDTVGVISQLIQACLNVIRETSDCTRLLQSSLMILTDENILLKLKLSVLRFIHELVASENKPSMAGFSTSSEYTFAVASIIRMTGDKKSSDLRRAAQKVLISLYNLDKVEFNNIVAKLKKEERMAAATAMKHRSGSYGNLNKSVIENAFTRKSWRSQTPLITGYHRRPPVTTSSKVNHNRPASSTPFSQRSMNSCHSNGSYNIDMHTSSLHAPGVNNNTFDHTDNGLASAAEFTSSIRESVTNNTTPNNNNGGSRLKREHNSQSLADDFDNTMCLSTVEKSERLSEEKLIAQHQYQYLSPLIIQIAQQNESVEYRYQSMRSFMNTMHEIVPVVWEEHFDTILLLMIRTLTEPHLVLQISSLRILEYLLRNHSHRFHKYIELTVLKLLECQCTAPRPTSDGDELLSPTVDETVAACAASLPVVDCVQVLKPIVRGSNVPSIRLAAVRMMEQIIERMSEHQCAAVLPELVDVLYSAWDSEHSSIRKAAVFCLVAIHRRVGPEIMQPVLTELPANKIKLLNVYIRRKEDQLNVAEGGSHSNGVRANSSRASNTSSNSRLSSKPYQVSNR